MATPTPQSFAREVILNRGSQRYFPGLDPMTFDPVSMLAQYLRDNPESWFVDEDEGMAGIDACPVALATYAETCGAKRMDAGA